MRRLLRPLLILVALVFLFEAWLWEHLRPLVAAVVNVIAWDRLKARLATLIEWLPPWAVLIVFVIPFIVLLPLKFAEVYFLVHKQWLAAIFVLVLAKLLGLGVTAFIFDVTRPKLLQMAWFRWLYELTLHWLDKAHVGQGRTLAEQDRGRDHADHRARQDSERGRHRRQAPDDLEPEKVGEPRSDQPREDHAEHCRRMRLSKMRGPFDERQGQDDDRESDHELPRRDGDDVAADARPLDVDRAGRPGDTGPDCEQDAERNTMIRSKTLAGPPVANGTIRVIGREG